jgi:serine/threonine protein kinase
LFSPSAGSWKLADFGTCSEATSKELKATIGARGTSGYRAPEVIKEDGNWAFNNKSDMWALGCIIYELFSATKAFSSDWEVREYTKRAELMFPVSWPSQLVARNQHCMSEEHFQTLKELDGFLSTVQMITVLMLSIDLRYRPSSKEALDAWSRLKGECSGREVEEWVKLVNTGSRGRKEIPRCLPCQNEAVEVANW